MDKRKKELYVKEMKDIRDSIRTCDYSNNKEIISIMEDMALLLQYLINEL